MSKNPKNLIRKEFLKNFTKNVENRLVLVQKGNNYGIDINKMISNANAEINIIIQDANLKIHDRQIPYITLKAKYGDTLDKDVRIMLRNYYTKDSYENKIKDEFSNNEDISHLIDFLIVAGLNKITISDLMLDAEIIIQNDCLETAITDIILDILMFNSYSFLRKMDIKDKKIFSKQKFEFFKDKQLPCFYEYSGEDLLYYSLAFSARNKKDEFDIDLYISYWNEFINKYYPQLTHKEESLKSQIEQHIDFGELPKNYYRKFYQKPKGAYFIIRTNKDRTEKYQEQICSVFGLKEYEYGKVKIVSINRYTELKNLFENLDVSAFKVVKS